MEITCLMQTGTLSAVAGLWGSLASLWQSRSPVGTTEEGPSTSPALREPHTDPTYFLTTPGASRSVSTHLSYHPTGRCVGHMPSPAPGTSACFQRLLADLEERTRHRHGCSQLGSLGLRLQEA